MRLLDAVVAWDAAHLHAHRLAPPRRQPAARRRAAAPLHLAEYGAQAMAARRPAGAGGRRRGAAGTAGGAARRGAGAGAHRRPARRTRRARRAPARRRGELAVRLPHRTRRHGHRQRPRRGDGRSTPPWETVHEHPSRRVLVSGGSGDLGGAICRELARLGHAVVVHAHAGRERAEALAAAIRADGGQAEVAVFDVADAGATRAALAALLEAGPIDALVHNAGVHDDAPLAGMSDAVAPRHRRVPARLLPPRPAAAAAHGAAAGAVSWRSLRWPGCSAIADR